MDMSWDHRTWEKNQMAFGKQGWMEGCPLSPPLVTACVSLADGLAAFRAFLKTEFSEENLEFWLACEDFKKTRSAAKLASKAQRIFEEFIDVQAPREVGRPSSWAGRASLWDAGTWGASPPSPPRGDGEVRVRRTGMPSCLLQLALLTVTHPMVRATTLTILLVTTSEFASNYNLHFLTTMSFLGVFHPTSLIYYQSPRLLVSFLTGNFV